MLGLMTVKRHREKVARYDRYIGEAASQFDGEQFPASLKLCQKAKLTVNRLRVARDRIETLETELATLRAQLPTRGDKGKFVRREAV